jgi:hypothetical protein
LCSAELESLRLTSAWAENNKHDVVDIGMGHRWNPKPSKHKRSNTKIRSHFSLFEVCDNIGESEVKELERLFREIYRKDKRANRFNKRKKYKNLQKVRNDNLKGWKVAEQADSVKRKRPRDSSN